MTKKEFNLKKELNEIEQNPLLKQGFQTYLQVNNIKIKNNKELEKTLKEFKNNNAGA